MKEIKGDFSVQLTPQMEDPVPVGRLLIDKTYTGPLSGSGKGQMLSKRTAQEGSAGYVALEEFVGEVEGKAGSFTLMHVGVMSGGHSELKVQIVPDSGAEALAGISGAMEIDIADGKHSYRFSYSLPE
ncbi:DUF3224 domain-containing protein [Simiduia aestuariiviva]|uniref:DUF3224 domain-containing protein n=1 Tax=Simiduia aestuariiviva TaxID=1510459 RepID=A0A839URY6_9GAMM|nr:DUF3224 domain-containing protein [Simiduia aestuariiviva]MBB3169229.1 hypothetical protein [Simiduia aestuariiviva]